MFKKSLIFLPITIFIILIGFFVYRLKLIEEGNSPNLIPSVMIDRPAPNFSLPSLFSGKPEFTSKNLQGKVTLISVFASWCLPCRSEHSLLNNIKNKNIVLVGINYKDNPKIAMAWLEEYGNPYDIIAADYEGNVAIDFGVYGVPESYLIDKNGIIRFKQTGPLTLEVIENTLLPMAEELNK